MNHIKIIASLIDELDARLNTETFVGVQFKMHEIGEERWNRKGVFAIRCNRISIDEIGELVDLIFEKTSGLDDLIERISVNKVFAPSVSGRKRFKPKTRTVYITICPLLEIYNELWESLSEYQEYSPIDALLDVLYDMKERMYNGPRRDGE